MRCGEAGKSGNFFQKVSNLILSFFSRSNFRAILRSFNDHHNLYFMQYVGFQAYTVDSLAGENC